MDGGGGLSARWAQLWQRLGLAGDAAPPGEALLRAWGEPQRAYHTLEHLHDCLVTLDRYRTLAQRADEVELALWFHDAVYDPRRHDNEQRSAQWAVSVLDAAGADAALTARVQALIMATCHTAAPTDPDECLLVDIDLSILGASRERYDRFDRAVRAEYRHVPLPMFVLGRQRVLRSFLQRPQLYSTLLLRDQWELSARANLRRSLAWSRVLLFMRA